jgi:hypothetical protein
MESGRFGAVVGMVLAIGAAFVAGACSDGKNSDAATRREWVCFEGSASCECQALGPSEDAGGVNEVDACFDTSCCLLTQSAASDVDATCECLVGAGDCEAEAKSRRQTAVVGQCPPAGEGPEPLQCAADGENCRQQYLDQNQLSGCCQGSICKVNSAQVPVCQSATEDELSALTECTRARHADESHTLTLVTETLTTSVGELSLPSPDFVHFGVGAAGCVSSLEVSLDDGAPCQFDLSIEQQDGVLTVTRIAGTLHGCPGFNGSSADGFLAGDSSTLRSAVAAETVSCDGGLIFESYCVGGRLDIRLDGEAGGVAFDDQHIILQGGMCQAEPDGECPASP